MTRRHTPLDVDGPLPLDMLRAIPLIRRDPLTFLQRCVERHGDLVAFPMPRTPVLLVNEPVAARRVLQDNHPGYGKQTVQYRALSLVTGEGLLTADGDAWRRRRRVAQPGFRHETLPGVAQAAGDVATALAAAWQGADDGVLDVDAALMRAMLDVVGRTLFAARLGGPGGEGGEVGEVADRVVAAVDDALHVVVARAASPLPARLQRRSARRLHQANATLDALCAELVRRRLAAGIADTDRDVLALLLRAGGAAGAGAAQTEPTQTEPAPGSPMTDREVRDEIVTLVIAGHETVASSLTWTLDLLGRDVAVQARLHAELDAALTGDPTWADLPGLRYTRAVVDEALRLYPPAWVITRRALEEDRLAGIMVPPGTLVIISPWLLHRRPASWPDPNRFDPDRFRDAGRVAPGVYLPFGAGPRLCIGRDVALVEAVLVLATLLRRHRVEAVRQHAPRVDALVTLRPRGGSPMRLVAR